MKEAFTTTARLFVDKNEVIWVQYADGVQIGAEDIKNLYSVIRRLASGRMPRVIVDVRKPYSITTEAREQAIAESKDSIATAIITSNVLYKYVSDIYSKFNTNATPVKVFLGEEKALEWILSIPAKD